MYKYNLDAKTKRYVALDTSRDVSVRHEHLIERSFAGLRKGSFAALGCKFERCDFSDMRPSQIWFATGKEQTCYIDCTFDRSKFKRIVVGRVRFEKCTFLNVEIRSFFGHAADFVDCRFSGVLRGAVFFGHEPAHEVPVFEWKSNEFHGNDFSKTKFIDVGFRAGIDLSSQILPAGDEYFLLRDAATKLSALRKKYVEQPPSRRRQDVFEFLDLPEKDVREGQEDLFFCKDSLVSLSPEARDAIWAELRAL